MYPEALSASPLISVEYLPRRGEPDKLSSVDSVKRNVSLSTFYIIRLHVSEDVWFYRTKKDGKCN